MATNFSEIIINKDATIGLVAGVSSLVLQKGMPNYDTEKLVYLGVDVDQTFTHADISCESKQINISLLTDTANQVDVTNLGDGVLTFVKGTRRTVNAGLIKRLRFAVQVGPGANVNIRLYNG